jgi:hypothetical protein
MGRVPDSLAGRQHNQAWAGSQLYPARHLRNHLHRMGLLGTHHVSTGFRLPTTSRPLIFFTETVNTKSALPSHHSSRRKTQIAAPKWVYFWLFCLYCNWQRRETASLPCSYLKGGRTLLTLMLISGINDFRVQMSTEHFYSGIPELPHNTRFKPNLFPMNHPRHPRFKKKTASIQSNLKNTISFSCQTWSSVLAKAINYLSPGS